MNYRRKSGKRLAGCFVLVVLLAAVILAVLWAGGFFNLFSAPIKKVKGNSSRPAGLTSANRLRHEIYDHNMSILAVSLRMYSVYVRPLEMKKGQNAVRRLVKILAVDNKKIQRQLRTKRSLIWLKRYISAADAKKIAALHFRGIHLASERSRLYPHGSTASQVIGFVKAGQGLAGIEFAYDNLLRGDWPMEPANQQASGIDYRGIPTAGAAVVLSLDLNLQSRVEERLASLIKKNGAQSGMAVLMNADNGEILAMVNLPAYNPNHYWNFSSFNRRNRVDSDPVYLGGLVKYFQLAAAVQFGAISGPAGRPNQDARLISPRKMKRLPSGGLLVRKPVWQRVRDGIYLLPYINEPVIAIGDARFTQFVRQLGMGQSPVAEPFAIRRPLAQVTLLDLAAAFGRTINGGRTFIPHLLHGVWLGPDKGEIKAHFVPAGRRLLPNSGFINFLRRDFRVEPAKPLVFESLVTVQEKVAAAIDFAKADSAGKIKAGIREPADVKRVEATGIGVYTAGSAPLVLVMSMDGIRDSPAVKPVFSRAISAILADTSRRKVTSYKKNRGGAVRGRMLQRFKRQWRKIHLKTTLRLPTGHTDAPIFMPKLRGFSLRKSLQTLSGYGLRILISGAGRVVRQIPKAGTSLKSGQSCRLELRYQGYGGS